MIRTRCHGGYKEAARYMIYSKFGGGVHPMAECGPESEGRRVKSGPVNTIKYKALRPIGEKCTSRP